MEMIDRVGRLAGFFFAHAVWSIEEGEALVPIIGALRGDARSMARYDDEDLHVAVMRARAWMASNPDQVDAAVLIVDGFVTLTSGRTDALITEVSAFAPERWSLQVVTPYRARRADVGFAVHRPKFAVHRTFEGDVGAFSRAFMDGAASHARGWACWERYKDESI